MRAKLASTTYVASVALDYLLAPNQMAFEYHIDPPRKTALHLRSSGSPAPSIQPLWKCMSV